MMFPNNRYKSCHEIVSVGSEPRTIFCGFLWWPAFKLKRDKLHSSRNTAVPSVFLDCRLSLYLYTCRLVHLSSLIREAFLLSRCKYTQKPTTVQLQKIATSHMCVLRLTAWDWIIYGWGCLCWIRILLSAVSEFLYWWVRFHEIFLSTLTCL